MDFNNITPKLVTGFLDDFTQGKMGEPSPLLGMRYMAHMETRWEREAALYDLLKQKITTQKSLPAPILVGKRFHLKLLP